MDHDELFACYIPSPAFPVPIPKGVRLDRSVIRTASREPEGLSVEAAFWFNDFLTVVDDRLGGNNRPVIDRTYSNSGYRATKPPRRHNDCRCGRRVMHRYKRLQGTTPLNRS